MERCELTDLPKEMCAHCLGYDWDVDRQQYIKPLTFEGLLKQEEENE